MRKEKLKKLIHLTESGRYFHTWLCLCSLYLKCTMIILDLINRGLIKEGGLIERGGGLISNLKTPFFHLTVRAVTDTDSTFTYRATNIVMNGI